MQFFSDKLFPAVHLFVLVLSTCCFLVPAMSGAEDLYNIHIEWEYAPPADTSVDGFYLYKNNSIVCETNNAEDRAMNCIFGSAAGTFDFYLSAYSEDGQSPLSAPFPYTLSTIVPPQVEINADRLAGNLPVTVTFSAGLSQGSAKKYRWSFGDTTGNFLTTENQTTHTYYIAGTYTVSVTAIDLNNNQDTQTLVVNVSPQDLSQGGTPPTASIRSSITNGAGPFSVSFDGMDSTAANGEISKYLWNFDDNSHVSWGDTAVHTYSIPGIYHPTLTVIDSQGIVHTTSVTVVVAAPVSENCKPIADFSCTVVQNDDSLILAFDASPSNDTDGQIESYVWNMDNSAFKTGCQITQTFPVNQVHTITLTVTDDTGMQHSKSMNTITFLKDIHAAVVYHINSLLLKSDKSISNQ